ncbi:helix-turn-helix domain-containing protein [Bdellovibrio svalbardensis]|uniref:XRE family transcriptional regulator n=1 Tax=Bdellovibrio svalbardensis TaxID=2972972 RepID=A0ABT6DNS0_9BACT|nr:XRE family transcriptional regulator [Bdellovibrio svalbardensis]MDG0816783.1 XRE family transcriptional regulator [Bdellovibrio svalbardensis]
MTENMSGNTHESSTEIYSLEWNKESVRALRLRLGWSKSDMARRLKCSLTDVEAFEEGQGSMQAQIKGELEIMYRQCQECSDEVKYTPASELALDKNALEQIEFSRVKADLE